MSQSSNIGDNPNDRMPPGVPLEHDELASDFSEEQRRDDGADGEDPGTAGNEGDEGGEAGDASGDDRENQSGSGGVNPDKFT